MYHDEIGFDTIALDSPLACDEQVGPAGALEQGFSSRLLGLILASDLFAARGPGPRHWLENVALQSCWDGADIRFSGEQLDQDDLDAFLGCVILAFRNPGRGVGSTRFFLRDLTRLIRPRARRLDSKRLERSLWRLAAARIEIEDAAGEYHIQSRLLHTLLSDRAAGICAVDVNPRIMEGFRSATVVERLLTIRAPLGSAGFRRWLIALFSNVSSALRLDILALRRLSGLTHQPVPAFRERALAALRALQDLGYIATIEAAGPDRLVVQHRVSRGEDTACILLC